MNIIVALDSNMLIGNNNSLPWHLPEDLARFKKLTEGNTVIMGRKTYESIGKALPDRLNIVLTKNKDYKLDDAIIANSIDEIFEINTQGDIYVIGGAHIYGQFYKFSKKIYLTTIEEEHIGDAYFPIQSLKLLLDFFVESAEHYDGYSFFNLERRKEC